MKISEMRPGQIFARVRGSNVFLVLSVDEHEIRYIWLDHKNPEHVGRVMRWDPGVFRNEDFEITWGGRWETLG